MLPPVIGNAGNQPRGGPMHPDLSLLGAAAVYRLCGAMIACALLWLAVAWALEWL